MAIVTLAYPRDGFPQPVPGRSGFLVPAVDGRAVKAVTFSTVKWPHLRAAPGSTAWTSSAAPSAGWARRRVLQRDDAELAALAAADLAAATGVARRASDARVTRWGGGLPQYSGRPPGPGGAASAPGSAAQPGLAVCGAAYDGVGIPACIATGAAGCRPGAGAPGAGTATAPGPAAG